jgi:hypothetical protein
MEAAHIKSKEDLSTWLKDKPTDWAQVIAIRSALRGLPYAVADVEKGWMQQFAMLVVRAALVTWSAKYFSDGAMDSAVKAAGDAMYSSSTSAAIMATAKSPQFSAYSAIRAASRSTGYARVAIASRDAAVEAISTLDSWEAVSADCKWLVAHSDQKLAALQLNTLSLWQIEQPKAWQSKWQDAVYRLVEIYPHYKVWVDWYELRLRGVKSAFYVADNPRDTGNEKILSRISQVTDVDFWGKGSTYVNTTLMDWIDEARANAAKLQATPDVKIPPQNRNAISFRTDEDGRITIDASASVEQLRADTEARDRHAEAASEAQAVLDRCRGNNAAARLTLRLENYLAAIGSSIENSKPSLLVQRGEKLRQELAACTAPDTLLDPIADDILVDLKGWQSSHNMMIGLDPVLMAIDTSMLGPDRRPALIPPDEIKQFVHDTVEANLLAEGTEDILIEAADLAPAIPDPDDRRTNASIEMVRNLCIEIFSIVLNNPKLSMALVLTATGASSSLFAAAASGFSLMSSIKAAEYLVAHRQWIEEKMGNTPTWQALYVKVADWLQENTPFKPK